MYTGAGNETGELEIIIDLPFGFPINNIISLSGEANIRV